MSPKLLTMIILGGVFFCSDVNSAPSGLYIRSYYKGYYKAYLNEKLSWNDAWVKCYQRRGRLAVIDNTNPYDKQAIVRVIKKYLVDYRRKWYNLWIGLKRNKSRNWYWRNARGTTDVKVDVYSNYFENIWGVRRQSSYANNCFFWMPKELYGGSWGWADTTCSTRRGYICQFNY